MNSTHPFDHAVVIGRFQPFHNGHAALLQQALASAPRVLVLLGSALQARTSKNPFSWEERAAMISATLDDSERKRFSFVPLRDYYDDRRWVAAARAAVAHWSGNSGRIALLGHLKDASSYYLQRFPDWQLLEVPQQGDIDATAVRALYFDVDDAAVRLALLQPLLPLAVSHYLQGWAHLPHYAALRTEQVALEESRKQWGSGPFITVDALVRAADQVLLVQRGRSPGKGLWALPGGFLEARERVLQGAMRELREETGLALLGSTLEGALAGTAVFDHPDRSLRGRTITHVHYFDLGEAYPPQVAGADDAAVARWFALDQLASMEQQFFEDHFHILDHFLALTA